MLRKLLRLVVLCAVAVLAVPPAHAQEPAAKSVTDTTLVKQHGWGFRLGYLKGDDIAKRPVGLSVEGGFLPEHPALKDSFTFGAFYYREMSPHFRVEARLSFAPTTVEHVCPDVPYAANPLPGQTCGEREGTVSALLIYADVVFMPHIDRGRFHLGVPFGAGWGELRANKDLADAGWLEGKSFNTELSASAGMTYFLGLRPYWELASGKQFFFETRALRFHRLVSTYDRTAKTIEATVGMSFPLKGKKKAAPAAAPAS